jgi:hypothetical protein
MRGQDRTDGKAAHERIELRVRPPEPPQARDRIRHRIVEDAIAGRPLAAAQGAHPTARLGQVDQAEVEREGADDRLGGAEVERPQLLVQSGALERVVVAAQGDGPPADSLDEREQLRPGLLRDDLPEKRTKQPDLDREGVARTRRPDTERLRGDGARRPGGAQAGHRRGPFRARVATRPQPFRPQPFRRLVS